MDENEKKNDGLDERENPAGQDDVPETPEENDAPGDGLQEELEGLRDLFQTELNQAKEQGSPLSTPVSDWENLVDTSAGPVELETPELPHAGEAREPEIPEEDRCILCEKRARDHSRGEDYPYCGQCREAMKKRPVSWMMIPLLLAIVACVAFSAVKLVDVTPAFQTVLSAQKAIKQGRLYDGLDAYTSVYQGGVNNDRITRRIIGVFYDAGYFNDISTLISQTYTESDLAKRKNRSIKEINDRITAVNNTSSAVGSLLSAYEDAAPAAIPYDDLIAKIDALADTDTTKYDAAIKEYYKYTIALKCEKDPDVQLGFLKATKEKNPGDAWLYQPPMVKCLTAQEKYEEALVQCDEMIKLNVQDGYYLATKASIYRRMKDYDKALAICRQGIDDLTDKSELNRQQAIVFLLQGKTQEAVNAASEAYDESVTVGTANTLALCHLVAGDTDGYNQIDTMLKGYDLKINSKVTDYQSGTKTLEDIFLKEGGDVL